MIPNRATHHHYVLKYNKLNMQIRKITYKFHVNASGFFFTSLLSNKELILNTEVTKRNFISLDFLCHQYFRYLIALVLLFFLYQM